VSISFGTERKRRRMAAALRFMSSARINERKKKYERIGPDQTLHRSRRPDWNKVRTECAPGTRLYILNGFYITIKLAYSINYTYRYKYRAYIYLILSREFWSRMSSSERLCDRARINNK
jgi:hypothetical protein